MTEAKLPEYPFPADFEIVLRKDIKAFNGMTSQSRLYLKVLEALKNLHRVNLSENHYLQLLKLGLYLEEYQNNAELRKHELIRNEIERPDPKTNKFKICIENFDEENSWIKVNDLAEITDIASKTVHTVKVISICQNYTIVVDDEARY